MSTEERLRSRLTDGLAALDPGPGDRAAVERLGRRLRRRRRVGEALVAVAVAAAVAVAVVVPRVAGDGGRRPSPAPPVGGSWHAGAPSPVGPRWMPVTAWNGTEAFVLGGGTDSPCPPNASCVAEDPMASDGAAYAPETDSWRRIADAPVPIGYWFRPVVVGATLVLFDGQRRWLAYDIESDTWSRLPASPWKVTDSGTLHALDGRVYVASSSGRVLALDVVRRQWFQLPVDRQEPRLQAYAVLPTDDGIFACGADPEAPDDGDTPAFTVVDRFDGAEWSARFPKAGSIGNLCEHWTGTRLANLDIQTAPGLDGNPPMGGRLDPETGEWSPLPGAPDVDRPRQGSWGLVAADGPLMAGWGYAYDDADGTWTGLGRPRGTTVDRSQGAVWADGRLLAFGGIDERTAYTDPSGLSDETWVWTP